MMIGKRHSNQGYGKLLLKTLSTRSDWEIRYMRSDKDMSWTVIDSTTKQVIDRGVHLAGVSGITIDLSLNTSEAELYIDVDDNGNAIKMIWLWYYNHEVTFINFDTLASLERFALYNDTSITIKIQKENTENLTRIDYLTNSIFKNADIVNNSHNLYYISFYWGNTHFNGDVFNISQLQDKLQFFSTYNTTHIELDTYDFRSFTQLYNFKYINDINIGDIYFNLDKLKYLYLGYLELTLPQLYTENWNELLKFELRKITHSTNIIVDKAFFDNKPKLTTLTLRDETNTTDDIYIESDSLTRLYMYYGITFDNLDIKNTPNLIELQFYSSNFTGFLIDNISQQNIEKLTLGGYADVDEWNFSEVTTLTYLQVNHGNFTKLNIKNQERAGISFSGHTYYKDACFIVKTPSDWDTANFRAGDTITDDETSCPT